MLCPFLQIMWMDIALAPPPSPVHLGGPESRGAPKVHASPAEGPADHPSARPSPPHAWRSLCLYPPSPKVCACSPTPLSLYSIFPHIAPHCPCPPFCMFLTHQGIQGGGWGFIAVFALIWLHFLSLTLCFSLCWSDWWLQQPFHATMETYPFSAKQVPRKLKGLNSSPKNDNSVTFSKYVFIFLCSDEQRKTFGKILITKQILLTIDRHSRKNAL